jgi:hypothetical protein
VEPRVIDELFPSAFAWLVNTLPLEIVVAPVKMLLPDRVSDPAAALIVNAPDPEITPVNDAENGPLTVKSVLPTVEKVWTLLLVNPVSAPPEAISLVPA